MMGRQNKTEEVLRPEVRLLKSHPAARRLLDEARRRDVSLAQHIHDLLIAREAALTGQDYDRLLWVPVSQATAPAPTVPEAPDEPAAPAPAAAAAAAWLRKRTG
jgi:hypothetical protein